jgi:hypothetical protein
MAGSRIAAGANTTAKSRALTIKLCAFMTGSLEYNQQQIDFAIISCCAALVLGLLIGIDGEVSQRGSCAVTPWKFGKRTCKPNSVVCGHSSRRSVTAYAHQRPTRRFRQLLEPPQRIGSIRSAAWLLAAASLPIWSCSVWGLPCLRLYSRSGALLPHLFTLTPARTGSPGEPFESFRETLFRGVAEAVSFLWHWPSVSLEAHIPDVIRHTTLRSSDFPPPVSAVNGSRQRPPGPPASVQFI